MLKKRLISLALTLACAAASTAAEVSSAPRLARLGRIWGTMRYSHPLVTYREIKWDDAAIRAIRRVAASDSDAELIAATSEMLAAIGDPATRVRSATCIAAPSFEGPAVSPAGADAIYVRADADISSARDSILNAKLVIVDLRARGGCSAPQLSSDLGALLHRESIQILSRVRQYHFGYRSQHPDYVNLSSYNSSFADQARPTFHGTASTKVEKVVFLIDEGSLFNDRALMLATSGGADVVAAGRAAVRHDIATLPLVDGFVVEMRESMLLESQRRALNVHPDVTLPASASTEALIATARAVAASSKRRGAGGGKNPTLLLALRADDPYSTMREPSFEYRVLAAFRIFNIIDRFYGYKELIRWDDATFAEIIRELGAAEGQVAYGLALAKVMALVPDGHSSAVSEALRDYRGRAFPPFNLMPVEGKPVVTEILNDLVRTAGVKLGDELVAIDGKPAAQRYAELAPYMSAANETHHAHVVTYYLAAGPSNSTPVFTFRRPDGSTYNAAISRGAYSIINVPAKPWRILDGNIGYVDLEYLEVNQVDAMIKDVKGTRGLIIDIRSYPRGVLFVLARRLGVTGSMISSEMRIPTVTGTAQDKHFFRQDLGTPSDPYRGKTLALIDERAISQSEHTCLMLEAVAGTKFVGSPTAGANGNVTQAVVPGGIYVWFTGMDVRHADGRQLQRVGIVPDYPVPRTVSAIAAGRDEVLEKAIALMRE